jgi:hypothetical protein
LADQPDIYRIYLPEGNGGRLDLICPNYCPNGVVQLDIYDENQNFIETALPTSNPFVILGGWGGMPGATGPDNYCWDGVEHYYVMVSNRSSGNPEGISQPYDLRFNGDYFFCDTGTDGPGTDGP